MVDGMVMPSNLTLSCSVSLLSGLKLGDCLFLKREADLNRDLPVSDLSALDVATRLGDLEPVHVANRFPRSGQRILNGVFNAGRR